MVFLILKGMFLNFTIKLALVCWFYIDMLCHIKKRVFHFHFTKRFALFYLKKKWGDSLKYLFDLLWDKHMPFLIHSYYVILVNFLILDLTPIVFLE